MPVHVNGNTCHLLIYGIHICGVPIKMQAPYEMLEKKINRWGKRIFLTDKKPTMNRGFSLLLNVK